MSFFFEAAGLLMFANLAPTRLWLLPLYFVTFAIGHASWTIGQSTITADYFGTKRYASVRRLAASLQLPVSVVMPVVVGRMFHIHGNYRLIFIILGSVVWTGAIWQLRIRRPLWTELEGEHAEVGEPVQAWA